MRLQKSWARALLAAGLALSLGACGGGGGFGGDDEELNPMRGVPTPEVERGPLPGHAPQPQAETTFGQGAVKVALLLPTSASGNAGETAKAMRNAAELAIAESDSPDIQLILKDDGGATQGAQAAARSALDEGAQLVMGPLFAHSVAAAGQVARQKGVPVLAFSTDGNVASRGVYLLSFMPESDVQRIVSHAAAQGKRSFAALIPDTGYGAVTEAAFQQAVAKAGGRVVGLEHYADRKKMAEAVARLATTLPQADALFLPQVAEDVQTAVGLLATNGVSMSRLQLLGTGLWDDPALARDASLNGAWYAAPDDSGFRDFSERYRAKFGASPPRTASLAYDATSLVAALVKSRGAEALEDDVFANPSGFAGIDGAFRFREDGGNERALAVFQIQSGGARIVSPPPKSFGDDAARPAEPE